MPYYPTPYQNFGNQQQLTGVQYANQSRPYSYSGGGGFGSSGSFGGGGGFGIGFGGQTGFTGQGTSNVGATSRGTNPLTSQPIPDLSFADPRTLQRLNINELVYSPSAGGYLYQNRNYSGLGSNFGGDTAANRQAANFYNYIGSLPTRPRGTPALDQFYSTFGGGYPQGPSYNTILGNIFQNANPFMRNTLSQAGFGRTYQGPFQFGRNRGY